MGMLPHARSLQPRRLTGLVACFVLVSTMSLAPPRAEAVTVGGADINTAPAGQVVAAAEDAVNSLVGILTDGACAAGDAFGDPSKTLLCGLSLLKFTVRTEHTRPNGTKVVRHTPLVFGTATPLDINGDAVNDAYASVTPWGLNRVTFTVKKLVTQPNRFPAKVELIVQDPTNLGSPSRLAVGYDQTGSEMPYWFRAGFALTGISPLRFNVDIANSPIQAGTSPLTVIASMFQLQGDGTRKVRADASVGFTPAPTLMVYDVTLGESRQHVTVDSTAPTRVDAQVELSDNSDVQQITATVDELPSQIDVDVLTDAAGLRTVEYRADSTIDLIDGTYRQIKRIPAGGDIVQMEAYGKVTDLPQGLTLQQTGPSSALFTTHLDPIGSVEGGFAQGGTVHRVPEGESGALMRSGGGEFSVAGRIFGLRSVALDLAGPYAVEVESQTQPLHLRVEENDIGAVLDGYVRDLPAHVAMVIDPDNGHISYDAFGEEISEITVDAVLDPSTGSVIQRLHAGLYGIPAEFQLDFAETDNGFSAKMSEPVDRIELSADDGTNSVAVPGQMAADGTHTGPVDSGAALFMRPDIVDGAGAQFAAAARIFGLREIRFSDNPTQVYVKTEPGHVFDAVADVWVGSGPVTFGAEIDQLPGEIEVGLSEVDDVTTVDYDAFGHEIDRLEVRADGLTPLTGRIETIHGTITDLPPKLRLVVGGETGKIFQLDTFGDAIGVIEAQALSAGASEVEFPIQVPTHDQQLRNAPNGVVLRDLLEPDLSPGEFVAALRLSGLRGASLQVKPNIQLGLDVDPDEAELFGVDVETQGIQEFEIIDDQRQSIHEIAGFVDQLPPNLLVDLNRTSSELVKYSAGAPIEEIFLRGREYDGGADAVSPRSGDTLRVRVQDVPTYLRVCFDNTVAALASTRCPYQPRPSDWPVGRAVTGDVHGDHLAVIHIDDAGTSSSTNPMVIDLYACLKENEGMSCTWNQDDDTDIGPVRYVKIDDLRIRNLFLDAYIAACSDGLTDSRLCAHFALDTNQTKLSGDVRFFDGTIGGIESIAANVHFPDNFLANDRYVYWDHTLFTEGPTDVLGSVTCLPETVIGATVTLLGGGEIALNAANMLLGC